MKFLSLVFPLLVALTSLSSFGFGGENNKADNLNGPIWKPERIHLTTSIIGPYVPHQEDMITVDIKNDFRVTKVIELKIFVTSSTYGKRAVYYSKPFYLGFDSLFQKQVKIDNAYLTSAGLTYQFLIISEDKTITYLDKSFTLYPFERSSFDVNGLTHRLVKTESNAYRFLRNSLVKMPPDQFDFTKSIEIFDEVNYYCLDISKFRFFYNKNNLPTFLNANLSFKDLSNAFTELANYRLVNLPLTIVKDNDGSCYFKFLNPLYVDPNRFTSSLKSKPGYIKTDRLYLPRNEAKNLIRYKFCFTVNDAGKYQTSFKYELGYNFGKYLLGDCSNSSFCIVGGRLDG